MKKLIFLLTFFALAYTAQAQTQQEYKFRGVAYSDLPITAKLVIKGNDAYLTIKQMGAGTVLENVLGTRRTSTENGKSGYIFRTNKWTVLMYDISEELGYEAFNIFTGSIIAGMGQEPPKNDYGMYLQNSLLIQNNVMKKKASED